MRKLIGSRVTAPVSPFWRGTADDIAATSQDIYTSSELHYELQSHAECSPCSESASGRAKHFTGIRFEDARSSNPGVGAASHSQVFLAEPKAAAQQTSESAASPSTKSRSAIDRAMSIASISASLHQTQEPTAPAVRNKAASRPANILGTRQGKQSANLGLQASSARFAQSCSTHASRKGIGGG
ncbi:hypothetical protein ABBQ38_004614 [Trebouxia sp. C0009 RCD-2024]